MDRDTFLAGVFLFVIGLVALYQRSFEATILMMGLGLGFMAVALGKDFCEDLYESFKSIFEDILDILR